MIGIAEAHSGWDQAQIKKEFASKHTDLKEIDRITGRTILQDKHNILQPAAPQDPHAQRARTGRYRQLEVLLREYFNQASGATQGGQHGACQGLQGRHPTHLCPHVLPMRR